MTDEERNEQLAIVRAEAVKAREAFTAAKTDKAKRQAAEKISFWCNKAASLVNSK